MPRQSKRNSPGPHSRIESIKQKARMEKLQKDMLVETLRGDIAQRDVLISILRGRIKALKQQLRATAG